MDYGRLIHLVDAFENALAKFLSRGNLDLFEEGACHLSKERLDDVQPGAVRRGQYVLEAVGTRCQKGSRLFGNV